MRSGPCPRPMLRLGAERAQACHCPRENTYSLERCARSLAPHTYAASARALPSASAQRLRAICNRRPRELRAFDVSVLNALGVARAAAHRAHHLARRSSCALATDSEAPRRQLTQGELRFRPNESPPTPASIAARLRCAMARGSRARPPARCGSLVTRAHLPQRADRCLTRCLPLGGPRLHAEFGYDCRL